MKKTLLLLLLFTSCLSGEKLAKKCKENFPCIETVVYDTSKTKIDTFWHTTPLVDLPTKELYCIQYTDSTKLNYTVLNSIPCPSFKETIQRSKLVTVKDSSDCYLKAVDLEYRTKLLQDLYKKFQRLKTVCWCLGFGILLLLLIIGRLSRKILK